MADPDASGGILFQGKLPVPNSAAEYERDYAATKEAFAVIPAGKRSSKCFIGGGDVAFWLGQKKYSLKGERKLSCFFLFLVGPEARFV